MKNYCEKKVFNLVCIFASWTHICDFVVVVGLVVIFFLLTNVLVKCLDLCVHMGWQIPLVPGLTLVMAELAAAAAPNAHTVHCNITQHLHQSISNPALLRGVGHPGRTDGCSAELQELLVPVLEVRLSQDIQKAFHACASDN